MVLTVCVVIHLQCIIAVTVVYVQRPLTHARTDTHTNCVVLYHSIHSLSIDYIGALKLIESQI